MRDSPVSWGLRPRFVMAVTIAGGLDELSCLPPSYVAQSALVSAGDVDRSKEHQDV